MWVLSNTQRDALAAARNNPERAELVKAADDSLTAHNSAYAEALAQWNAHEQAIASIITADRRSDAVQRVHLEASAGAVVLTGRVIRRFPWKSFGTRRVGQSGEAMAEDIACVRNPSKDGTAVVMFVRADGSDSRAIDLRLTDGREKGSRSEGWSAMVFIEPEALRAAAAEAEAKARAKAQDPK
jgi:hypothetical protein